MTRVPACRRKNVDDDPSAERNRTAPDGGGLARRPSARSPLPRRSTAQKPAKAGRRGRAEKRRAPQQGRAGDQRAARHPDRRRERRRAVRARSRQADLPGQPRQADDRRIRVPRTQRRPHQAHRRIHRERERLAQGRRALARLHHVRGDPQQGSGRRPAARHDHPVRQRCLHRAGRRDRRQRSRFRRQADRARARDRPRQIGVHQFERAARSQRRR